MATSVTKGGTQKLAKYFTLVGTDMTIHWKAFALEVHFLMVPLDFRFRKMQLLNFSLKKHP
jgi:hypothetical protein